MSQDGLTWQSVSMAPFGKDSVYSVDGGGAGYIATGLGANGATPMIWTSTDGSHWNRSTPPVSSRTGFVNGATAFAGGFVAVGATRGEEGCGSSSLMPSVWWSADGGSWSRATLPGVATSPDVWMSVCRLDDHEILATAQTYDQSTQTSIVTRWRSLDGKAWKPFTAPDAMGPVVTDGQRAIASGIDDKGNSHFWAFEPDGSLRELSQTGQVIDINAGYGGTVAVLGPAGVVQTDSMGSRFYLGVPTGN
jgi:hypothetical protein